MDSEIHPPINRRRRKIVRRFRDKMGPEAKRGFLNIRVLDRRLFIDQLLVDYKLATWRAGRPPPNKDSTKAWASGLVHTSWEIVSVAPVLFTPTHGKKHTLARRSHPPWSEGDPSSLIRRSRRVPAHLHGSSQTGSFIWRRSRASAQTKKTARPRIYRPS